MPQRILVIEDDPEIVNFIDYLLTEEGYNVFTSDFGNDLLSEIENFAPDLVIMDANHQVDYRTLCKKIIKKHDVKVVLLSTELRFASEIVSETCATKPFDIDQFLNV
ncbi:MAG TPA: response regulator [Pedobacter sp.]|jgi:DNA-binding response OmpR family regulator